MANAGFLYDGRKTVAGVVCRTTVLADTPVKNWGILLEQSFTADMPLLM